MEHDETTPPTVPATPDEALTTPEAPTWPKVIGIISIVWGSLSVTCSFLSPLAMVLARPMMEEAAGDAGLPPAMTMTPAKWASIVASVLLAILLIAAGVATVMRSRVGRTLHLVYAVLGIIVAFISLGMQLRIQEEMAQWAADNPDSAFAAGQNPAGAVMGFAFAIVFGLGWPLFCLLWFTVSKRAKDMGRTPPRAQAPT